MIVGIWNTVFGYGIFIVLHCLFSQLFYSPFAAYMTASALGNILAITNAFVFHKYITFRSSAKGMDAVLEYGRFWGTYLFTFVLGLVLLPLFVELLGMTPQVGAAFVIVVCMVVSYLGHSRYSFRAS
ncbi:MAG: GtrA family protein [Syntrophales bacterium]|nr:GtrA family protein [Syntrophales bacterium]